MVSEAEVAYALSVLGLPGKSICVHSSLRSFGNVEGGAVSVVSAYLNHGCTLLVPTFSFDAFGVAAPPDLRPERNGTRYDYVPPSGLPRIFTPASTDIDADMGAIPSAVVTMPDRVRGDHPLCSFSAVGPQAKVLVQGQRPTSALAPLQTLAMLDGYVVLMGVDLTSMTLLHLAEEEAGRRLFVRWALDRRGRPMRADSGGCSDGFGNFEDALAPYERNIRVGESLWKVYPVGPVLDMAADAIRRNPHITRCAESKCLRCEHAIAGGPVIP